MKKEILTVERCRKDIRHTANYNIFVMLGVIVVFALMVYSSYCENGMTPVLYILAGLEGVLVFWLLQYSVRYRKLFSYDNLFIVTDVLTEKKGRTLGQTGPDKYMLTFSKYGRYEIPPANYRWHSKRISDERLYSHCLEGDKFYLVLDKGKSGEIIAVYNKRHFDLSGELSAKLI